MKTSKKLTIMGLSAATALVAATGAVSSFAWFAVNGSVTATGMKIKATATDAYLQIKKSVVNSWNDTDDFTSVEYTAAAKTLKPTAVADSVTDGSFTKHTAGKTDYAWAYATSNSVDRYTASSKYTNVTEAVEGNGDTTNVYALIYDFDLRLKYSDSMVTVTKDVKAEVSFGGDASEDALRNAVSVFMVSGAVEANTLDDKQKALLFTNSSGTWTCDVANGVIISNLQATKASNDGTKVRFYAFFNGEDKNCKTSHVKTTSVYSLNVKFSID